MSKSKALVAAEARIQILEATLRSKGLEIERLRNELAQRVIPGVQYREPAAAHRSYVEYVADCRRTQRAAGAKTIKYLSFEQWKHAEMRRDLAEH